MIQLFRESQKYVDCLSNVKFEYAHISKTKQDAITVRELYTTLESKVEKRVGRSNWEKMSSLFKLSS